MKPEDADAPSHRTAALYHVRAALFWAGAADRRGVVRYGHVKPSYRKGVVGKKQTQLVHRLAALWQFMVLKGTGLEDKLSPELRKLVEGQTASHLMFGFAGAERNCNPWHVRGGMGRGLACCLKLGVPRLFASAPSCPGQCPSLLQRQCCASQWASSLRAWCGAWREGLARWALCRGHLARHQMTRPPVCLLLHR